MNRAAGAFAAFALVLSAFAAFSVPSAHAANPTWDASGAYVFNFNYDGADHAHSVTLAQDGSGVVTGSGSSGAYEWVIDSGWVSGDTISLTAHYTAGADAVTPLTAMSIIGTNSGGSMSGIWSDNYQGGSRSGTWTATSSAIAPASHTIAASAGANGTTTPSGAVSVPDGGSQTFVITPDAGYHVADVLVDSESVGATTTYAFSSTTADHTISASFEADAQSQPSTTTASRNRRNGGSGRILGAAGAGEVEGAETGPDKRKSAAASPAKCANSLPISTFMRMGAENDQEQVKLLQAFLAGEMGTTTPITGLFDAQTDAAVRAFQHKYADEILAPWGISEPTGQVYLLTQWKINSIACPSLNVPKPYVEPQEREESVSAGAESAAVAPIADSITLSSAQAEDTAAAADDAAPQAAAVSEASSAAASSTPGLFGKFVNWLFGK